MLGVGFLLVGFLLLVFLDGLRGIFLCFDLGGVFYWFLDVVGSLVILWYFGLGVVEFWCSFVGFGIIRWRDTHRKCLHARNWECCDAG